MMYLLQKVSTQSRSMGLSLLLACSVWAAPVSAAPTPEQIQMFKTLPKAQQDALLKQQGIDPAMVQGAQAGTAPAVEPMVDTVQPLVVAEPVKTVEQVVVVDEAPAVKDFKGFEQETQQVKKVSLQRYGASLFAGQPTTFAPVNDIPVQKDYVLGPGDTLKVQLYGGRNELYKLIVDRNGAVAFPDVGPINLAGLSLADATQILEKTITTLGTGISSSITLGDLRSFRIFVMGEARVPGTYLVSGMATMTHALYVSGGISDIGSFRNIQLKRRGNVIAQLDLYDLLTSGDTSQDLRLQSGDTVFIPVMGKTASVQGQVNRPAVYELKNETTFKQLLKLAGGATSEAYLKAAKVTSVTQKGYATVAALDLSVSKGLNAKVNNGDVLTIPGLTNDLDKVVNVAGEVQRPGVYPWHEGMTIGEILKNRDAFGRNADLDYLVVLRQLKTGDNYQVHTFSWREAIKTKGMELQSRDRVFVFSKFSTEKRVATLNKVADYLFSQASLETPAPVIQMKGLVKYPGQYPLANQASLMDMLSAAGYLLPKADTAYILVQSFEHLTGKTTFKQVALEEAGSVNLQPLDQVYVFSVEANERVKRLEPAIAKLSSQATFESPPQIINIQGSVRFEGRYPLVEDATLASAITAAGGLSPMADTQYVLVQSKDALTGDIAFAQYDLTQAKSVNLKPQDTVHLFSVEEPNRADVLAPALAKLKDQAKLGNPAELVSISGLVKAPGQYPLTPNLKVSDLINASGGLLYQALATQADLLRYQIENNETRVAKLSTINLQQAMAGEDKDNLVLKPGDQLIVKRIEGWETIGVVTLEGEVRYPGVYTISPGETMASVLDRAGGFNQWANPKGAVFTRQALKLQEERELKSLANELEKNLLMAVKSDMGLAKGDPTAILNMGQTLVERVRNMPALGRLVVGLDESDADRYQASMAIELRDGDRLVVPKRSNEVLVTGEVSRTASLIYQPGQTVSDYIKLTGGMTKRADTGSVFVVHVDGSIEKYQSGLFSLGDVNLAGGDTIVVPLDVERMNPLVTWTSISSILSNFAVTTATLKTIGVIK